jgi:hypothetical protein
VSGTITPDDLEVVSVSWRSRHVRRTLGHGTRLVAVNRHAFALTFELTSRQAVGTIGVAARSGSGHVLAGARARRVSTKASSYSR